MFHLEQDESDPDVWAVVLGDGSRLALLRREGAAQALADALSDAWEAAFAGAIAAVQLRYPADFIDPPAP
jgi:hypothetical protein